MDDIIIRKANIEDLEEIVKLNKTLFELEFDNYDDTLNINWPLSDEGKAYFTDAINNSIAIVAVSKDTIIGYLIGCLNTEYSYNNVHQAELENMCVLDEYRKNGIGTKLFQEFVNICKENNIEEIKVTASFRNKNAIEFYKKNDFIEEEIVLKQKIKR